MQDQSVHSRRTILKGAFVGLVTLPVLGTVACSRTPAATGAGGQGTTTVTIAVSALQASLDREFEIGAGSLEAMNNVFEPLVEFSRTPFKDGSYVPVFDVASWEHRLLEKDPVVSADGRTWELTFRSGVRSHSGNEFVAEDFAYALERHQQVWSLGSFYNFVAGLLPRERKAWEVTGRYTISVTTQEPSPLFKVLLQNNFAMGPFDSVVSREAATGEDPWSTAWMATNGSDAGHGPYTITEHRPGQQTVFTAFPEYYRGAPKVEKVVHRQVDSSSTRVALIRSGEVDVVRDLLPTEFESLQGVDGVVVDNFDQSLFLLLFMMMNNKGEHFANKQVRQAMAYAMPYDKIVTDVYRGFASQWRGVISRDYPYFDADAWPFGAGGDLARASTLLEQAGYGGGFTTELLYNASEPVSEQVAILVQSTMRELGVRFELKKLAAAAFTETLTGKQYPGAAIWQDLALTPDIGYNCFLYYRSTAFANVMSYESAETDALVDTLLTTMDDGARRTVAAEFQRRIIDDSPAVFLAQPHYVLARRERIRGITAYPSRTIRFDELEIA